MKVITKSNREVARWLWHSSRGLRLQAMLNALIGITSVILDFAFIYATKWTIDIATDRAEGSLRVAAYALIAIMVGKIFLGFSRKWVGALLGVRSQNILQQRLFAHLLKSEWNGREGRHSGDTLNRIEQDVRELTHCIQKPFPLCLKFHSVLLVHSSTSSTWMRAWHVCSSA